MAAVTHNSAFVGTVDAGPVITVPIFIDAGSNTGALIGISYQSILDPVGSIVVDVDGVLATFVQLVMSGDGVLAQYYILGLTLGSHTLTVTFDVNISGIAGIEIMNNVNQTAPIGGHNTNHSTGTALQVITSTMDAAGLVVDSIMVAITQGIGVTKDASQNQRWLTTAGSLPTATIGGGSSKVSSSSTVTMKWTLTRSMPWAQGTVEFKSQPDAPPPSVSLGGYTSYQYDDYSGQGAATPVESFKGPEFQQRIWNGDRRVQQQED